MKQRLHYCDTIRNKINEIDDIVSSDIIIILDVTYYCGTDDVIGIRSRINDLCGNADKIKTVLKLNKSETDPYLNKRRT